MTPWFSLGGGHRRGSIDGAPALARWQGRGTSLEPCGCAGGLAPPWPSCQGIAPHCLPPARSCTAAGPLAMWGPQELTGVIQGSCRWQPPTQGVIPTGCRVDHSGSGAGEPSVHLSHGGRQTALSSEPLGQEEASLLQLRARWKEWGCSSGAECVLGCTRSWVRSPGPLLRGKKNPTYRAS